MKKILSFLKIKLSTITKNLSLIRRKIAVYIEQQPYRSFFIALGLFLALIILSSLIGSPKTKEKKLTPLVKSVQIYSVGSAPRLTVQAQIEKSGVVHIVALAPGVIQSINAEVGQQVVKGETLLNLSSNYQGGNSFSLQRQLAQTQYQTALDNYDLQKDIIHKQKDITDKVDAQSDQLRSITDQSLSDTKKLTELNDDILSSLDQNLSNLESTNVNGTNDQLILSTKELKSQFLAANNQAKQASRSAQFASASDQPPAQLSDMQKDLTMKQLDLQEKMLDVNREISRIQLQISQVTEAMMYPSAPFNSTVQRILVKVGQQVNPGTELMILSQAIEQDPTVAIAYVPSDVAKRVSRLEPSIIHISRGNTFSAYPSFVTQDAVAGALYGVYFNVPDQYVGDTIEKGFVSVDLPIGYFNTSSAVPYIPVDAIYQTKDQSYVYVNKKGKAQVKSIELGNVYGSFVEIISGLGDSDKVILDRNVIAGDTVSVK